MHFWTYIPHCVGSKYYIDHTDDLERRSAKDQCGVVSGHIKNKLTVELVWSNEFGTRFKAFTAEL